MYTHENLHKQLVGKEVKRIDPYYETQRYGIITDVVMRAGNPNVIVLFDDDYESEKEPFRPVAVESIDDITDPQCYRFISI